MMGVTYLLRDNMMWLPKYKQCRLLFLTAKENPKAYGGEWANFIDELQEVIDEDEDFKSFIELRIPSTRMIHAKDVTSTHAKLVLDVLRDISQSAPINKEDDESKLNVFIVPNKPMYRIFELDDLKELKGFTGEWIVQEKFDGLRVQIHKLDTVKIYSFSGRDITNKFPEQVKMLKQDKFPKCILDAEAVLYKNGEPLHRADTIGYINKKDAEGEIKMHVFDILRHQGENIYSSKLEERIMTLFKEYSSLSNDNIQFPSKRDTRSTDSYDEIETYAKEIMQNPTSEGVVIKDAKSSYIIGKKKNPKWVKWKKFIDLDLIILDSRENKNGTYSYTLGAGPMDDEDEYVPEVKYNDKRYLNVGKALNTKNKIDIGKIIRVKVDEVQASKKGFSIYSAKFVEIPEVNEAERIITLKFLSENNKKRLSEYTVEALTKSYIITDNLHGTAIIKGGISMEGYVFHGFDNNNLMAKNALIDLDIWKDELGKKFIKDRSVFLTLVHNLVQEHSVTIDDIIRETNNTHKGLLERIFGVSGEKLKEKVVNHIRQEHGYGIKYNKNTRRFYSDDKIELKQVKPTFELWRRNDDDLNFIVKNSDDEYIWRIKQNDNKDLYNLFSKADKYLSEIDNDADKEKLISKGGLIMGSQRHGYHEYIIDSDMYAGKIHFRVVPIKGDSNWIVWTGYKTKPTDKSSDGKLPNIYNDKYKKLKYSQ